MYNFSDVINTCLLFCQSFVRPIKRGNYVYFFRATIKKKKNCSIKNIENNEKHVHIKEAGTSKRLIFLREKKDVNNFINSKCCPFISCKQLFIKVSVKNALHCNNRVLGQ